MAELRTVNPLVVGSSPTLGAITNKDGKMNTSQIIQESFYLLGKRIQLIHTDDRYTTLTHGDLGTINYIDDCGTIFVSWDNGSKLGLIPGIDKWKIVY